MKRVLILCMLLCGSILIGSVTAHEDVTAGENLVKSKALCEALNDHQLEEIGEYYMEQMHPGEAHERMDAMMGGEGSASLKQAHVNLAKSFYCGEEAAMPMSMMNTIMGRGVSGMMGTQTGAIPQMGGFRMMSLAGSWTWGILGFLYVLVVAFVISVVFWLSYKLVMKNKKR